MQEAHREGATEAVKERTAKRPPAFSCCGGAGRVSVAREAKVGPGEPEPPSYGSTKDKRQDRTACDQQGTHAHRTCHRSPRLVLWCNPPTVPHGRRRGERLEDARPGSFLEERGDGQAARGLLAEVGPGPVGGDPAPRGALDQPALKQERLVRVLNGVGLLADTLSQRGQAHR